MIQRGRRILSIVGFAAGVLGAGVAIYYWGYGDFITTITESAEVGEGAGQPPDVVGHLTGREAGVVMLLYAAACSVLLPGIAFWGGWHGRSWVVATADIGLWVLWILGVLTLGVLFALPAVIFLIVFILTLIETIRHDRTRPSAAV